MQELSRKFNEKTWYLIVTTFVVLFIFLVSVDYKNNQTAEKTETSSLALDKEELNAIKEFLVKKIKSPFFNINYEIKKGDTIQNILKKFKVPNKQIQNVISEFKKYGNPNNLWKGNKIDIVIEKNLSNESNSISKFSVPITKSTTIEIKKK